MNPEALDDLRAAVGGGDAILEAAADCWPYGVDNSRREALPSAVLLPRSHDEVVAIVRACNRHRLPLTPRGRGTGTTGAAVPPEGGVVIAFERMDAVIEVNPDDRLIVVQPGATNAAVQEAAARVGFFWPPDPTSAAFCTIGGNIAHNSAGPRAVRYGTTRDNTLGLRIVTGGGDEIRTGTRTTKGVVGYDLTRLVIGSEGTLAVVTEATLRLTPLPGEIRTIQAFYREMAAAARAVARIMAGPVTPYALEFMDATALGLIRARGGADLPAAAGALLMIEVDGLAGRTGEIADEVAARAGGEGCIGIDIAADAAATVALWRLRKALSPTLRGVAPKKINEDVVVPVSRMPRLIDGLAELSQRHGITIASFGHAGNGNIHVNLLVDPDDPGEMEAAAACLDDLFTLVLNEGGTISGEHGIGAAKRPWLDREIEPAALDLMRRIKSDFDPNGILGRYC